jgi:putative oxidoreductase
LFRGVGGWANPILFQLKMDHLMPNLSAWSPNALAVLRIMTALLFIEHRTQKFFAFPPSEYFPEAPTLFSLMGVAGILELVGGLLILVGLFTRPVAFVLSGFMAAAYFMGHAPQGFFPVNNMGDTAILFCFIFLYLVFAGPGAWSVDAARARGGSPATAAV